MTFSRISAVLLWCLVTETSSGVTFPQSLSFDREGTRSSQTLLGVGIRKKTLFRVEVYAVGLYASTRFEPRSRDLLASIREGRVDRSLRLVTTRSIDGEKMRGAFEKEMRPRFLRARSQGGLAGTDMDWQTFASFFDRDRLDEGTELVFSCDERGTLESTVNGGSFAPIESRALCYALFDVYIGPEPVSRKLKESLLARVELGSDGGSL